MSVKPLVSVVLGTYNRLSFLKLSADSIRQELHDFPHEIIVIDGGSTDSTLKWLTRQKDIISIIQHNRGEWRGKKIERRSWGYFMNLGFKCSQGKYVCMLSDDCLVAPGAIRNGYKLFEEELNRGKKVGAVAFYWRNWPEQENYWVGLTLGNKMFVNHGMYLKEALEDVGYIDEDTYHFYNADGDLCLKMWHKGYECVDSPCSYIEHFTHANLSVRASNLETEKEDRCRFLGKWSGIFYNEAEDNTGGWIHKEFHDPSLTFRHFRSRSVELFHFIERLLKTGIITKK